MGQKERRPGDPYEVGFGKPPKRTRFKKGRSGNPNGRPPKKPDVYSELTKVLREKVTRTVDGQPEKVTVQQALLLRLRDEALRGEVWAGKLLQKVVGAIPDSLSQHDDIDMTFFRIAAKFQLIADESARGKSDAAPNSVEPTNAE